MLAPMGPRLLEEKTHLTKPRPSQGGSGGLIDADRGPGTRRRRRRCVRMCCTTAAVPRMPRGRTGLRLGLKASCPGRTHSQGNMEPVSRGRWVTHIAAEKVVNPVAMRGGQLTRQAGSTTPPSVTRMHDKVRKVCDSGHLTPGHRVSLVKGLRRDHLCSYDSSCPSQPWSVW